MGPAVILGLVLDVLTFSYFVTNIFSPGHSHPVSNVMTLFQPVNLQQGEDFIPGFYLSSTQDNLFVSFIPLVCQVCLIPAHFNAISFAFFTCQS